MTRGAPRIAWIMPGDPPDAFPPVEAAFAEPDGLLAAGGDLSPDRLLYAYEHGIFPWYEAGQPILWWSPDPRCILRPEALHVARRLQRFLRQCDYELSFNRNFASVIDQCAGARRGQRGTWITPDMRNAYIELHRLGWAHSVEVWQGARLVGGVYGVGMRQAFFGESMFSHESNASKIAMRELCLELLGLGVGLIDCQVSSPHLLTLGATLVERADFVAELDRVCGTRQRLDLPPTGRRRPAESP